MPELVVRSRDGDESLFNLSDRPMKIGRSETCDVVLRNDGEVSREHAELWLVDGQRVMVADLNSKNGTRVDSGELFRNATRVAFKRVHIGEHLIEIRGVPTADAGSVVFTSDAAVDMGTTRFLPSSQRPSDLNQKRLNLLIGLGERLSGTLDRKQLLEEALDGCCDALKFERGLIALKTARGEPEMPVVRNVPRDETGAFKISRTLINRALVEGARAIVNNPATDLGANITESLVRFPICSALCVPIMHRDEILGVIYGDRVTNGSTYTEKDVDFFEAIARQVGVGLINLRMLKDHARAQSIIAELQHARTIQRMLLPPAAMTKGVVTVEGYNEPSSAVGGDYFDFFELDERRLGVIIADVTGHGLPAALLMANLQAAVRVAMTADMPLPALAGRVNDLICRNTSADVFITAVFGIVDTQEGHVEMVSAGHPGPILIGPAVTAFPCEANSLPLGVDPEERFEAQHVECAGGVDALLFYTDGLNEAAPPDQPILGLDAVMSELAALERRQTHDLIRVARNLVRRHLAGADHSDDMTLLALHFQR